MNDALVSFISPLPEGYADIKQPTQADKNMHNKAHKLLFSGLSLISIGKNISLCLCMFASQCASTSHIPYTPSLLLALLQQPPLFLSFISVLFLFLIYAQHTKHSILAVSAVAEIAVNEKRSPFIFFILPLLSACSL